MEWVEGYLQAREREHLLRTLTQVEYAHGGRVRIGNREYINFSSNDYLGLAGHPRLSEESMKAIRAYGTSSSGSRLMSGDLRIHHELENLLSHFTGVERALLFGSGYLANIGLMGALCDKGDVIFSDRLNHASIMDGIMLSGAKFFRFRHNDLSHLEDLLKKERKRYKNAFIVAESLFSMDGDITPLPEIVVLKEKYDALLILDEAHAIGVFGRNGAGVAGEYGLTRAVDIMVGTFGKALGSYGAFVGASMQVIEYCINRARSFIYSTGLPPSVIGASIGGMKMVMEEPSRGKILLERAACFRNLLADKGFQVRGASQIVPVIIGQNDIAVRVAEMMRERSLFAVAIRPPTVPAREARIRFSVTYDHTAEDLCRAADILADVCMTCQRSGQHLDWLKI